MWVSGHEAIDGNKKAGIQVKLYLSGELMDPEPYFARSENGNKTQVGKWFKA